MRLIDADALKGDFMFLRKMWSGTEITKAIDEAPSVDAVVLPCKIGDDVYIIPSKVNFDLNALGEYKFLNRVYHQKIAEIVFTQNGWYMKGSLDKEYGTDRILVDRFYKETWFLTEKEAEAALEERRKEK